MWSRVKNMGILLWMRVSCATQSALWAAVAGRREACATLCRRWGSGGGKAWVGVLFRHESFKAGTSVSDGNK